MDYFSIFDTQSKVLLETGRNSKTLEEAVEDAIAFVGEQLEDEDWNIVEKATLKDKIEFLGTDEYVIVRHSEKAQSSEDGMDYKQITVSDL